MGGGKFKLITGHEEITHLRGLEKQTMRECKETETKRKKEDEEGINY